jgi:hypothetical protein
VEEHKGEIQMCETIQVEIFWRDRAALSGVGPRLVVSNVNTVNTAAIFIARWSLDVSAATEVLLTSLIGIAKLGYRATESE